MKYNIEKDYSVYYTPLASLPTRAEAYNNHKFPFHTAIFLNCHSIY